MDVLQQTAEDCSITLLEALHTSLIVYLFPIRGSISVVALMSEDAKEPFHLLHSRITSLSKVTISLHQHQIFMVLVCT